MTTRAALPPGTILEERYRIVSILRAGGMGALYEAHDMRLADSPCAVKEMLPQHDGGSNTDYIRRRFIEEMKVLARLNHPDIPRVRDYFVRENLNYIVMDLVNGSNLLDALTDRQEPLPVGEVIRLGLTILSILEYLHGHTPPTVHRDIKPANILIEKGSGRFKLVDFGLACDASTGSTVHTQVGTLGYCPLEQIQGKAGPRSDLYALGATMHHLLTNQAPVPLQVAPLGRARPDLPPRLIEIVTRALAAKPEDRFADATSFRMALERVQVGPEAPRPTDDDPTGLISPEVAGRVQSEFYAAPLTAQVPSHPAWAWPLVGVLALAVAGAFALLLRPAPAPVAQAATPTPVAVAVAQPVATPELPRPEKSVTVKPAPHVVRPRPTPRVEVVVHQAPTPPPKPKPVALAPSYPTAVKHVKPTPAEPGASAPRDPHRAEPGASAPRDPHRAEPPPAPVEPPPQSVAPPPAPNPNNPPPPQGGDLASRFEPCSIPSGWKGPRGEFWPTDNRTGRPFAAVRDKLTKEVFPAEDGLPLHMRPGGPPGGGERQNGGDDRGGPRGSKGGIPGL